MTNQIQEAYIVAATCMPVKPDRPGQACGKA